jgi:hypothetical protein
VGEVPLYDLAWSPDGAGAFIVGAAGTVAWFDATEGIVVEIDFTSTHPLYSISWRPGTGTAWAVGEGGLVVELNSTTLDASRVRPYSPRDEDFYGVSWHPNGELALVVGQEGVTYLWRLGLFTRQLVDVVWDLLDAEWNPVGDEALVVGQDGSLLRYAPRVPTQNQPPNAVITSPTDGAEYEADGTIRLDGSSSSDPEDDDLTFTWTSNQSGILGYEPIVHVGLPVGNHLITLHVDDGQGHNVSDQVRIAMVKPIPPEERVHIDVLTPHPGALLSGEFVISGTASYERGTIASVEVAMDDGGWWPADGTTSWSLTLDTTIFIDGIHTLTIRATTSDGVSRSEDLLVEIRNTIIPEPPSIPNVTLRISESGIVDELLNFEAEADDLSPWILVWTFGDGSNAQGTQVNHAYSEAGTYHVSLELWLEGSEEPAAVFTATVIIKKASEVGQPIENILVIAVIAAAIIYVAGFYGGRRAFRRD